MIRQTICTIFYNSAICSTSYPDISFSFGNINRIVGHSIVKSLVIKIKLSRDVYTKVQQKLLKSTAYTGFAVFSQI